MSSVKELINAIETGDAVNIQGAFNAAMAEKIATNLDIMRQNVAQTMFNQTQESPATEE